MALVRREPAAMPEGHAEVDVRREPEAETKAHRLGPRRGDDRAGHHAGAGGAIGWLRDFGKTAYSAKADQFEPCGPN